MKEISLKDYKYLQKVTMFYAVNILCAYGSMLLENGKTITQTTGGIGISHQSHFDEKTISEWHNRSKNIIDRFNRIEIDLETFKTYYFETEKKQKYYDERSTTKSWNYIEHAYKQF